MSFRERLTLYLLAPIWIAGKVIENFCREGKCLLALVIVVPWTAIFLWLITWLFNHVSIEVH